MTGPRVVRLIDPLPCCQFAGWAYCDQPATLALVELRALATGHVWELRPFCEAHFPEQTHRAVGRRAAHADTP